MMMTGSIRRFSTRTLLEKLLNISQATKNTRSTKLNDFVDTYFRDEQNIRCNLINDALQCWAVEQPTKDALWTSEKLTFNDIHTQSSRFANVLVGEQFDLTAGKTVLAILPNSFPERLLLQLACLQKGLVFCPCDPKDLAHIDISQQIQKLTVDCVITNKDNLELARRYTHNPLRPLKKGLISKSLSSETLPVGWNHFLQSAHEAKSQYIEATNIHPNQAVIRFLSTDNRVIQYSQKHFNRRLVSTAIWLNMHRTSRLLWMNNSNEIDFIAPWLFGASIFHKKAHDLKTMLDTLKNHPIDSLYGSNANYEMLDNQQRQNQTQLKQLFSIESIDSTVKARWYSLTNLHIQDGYIEKDLDPMISQNCMISWIPTEPILPAQNFIYQYPNN